MSLLSFAPMMGYSHAHFRAFMRLLTRSTTLYTEMVNVNAVIHRADCPKFFRKAFGPPEGAGNLVLQLGGCDPNKFATAVSVTQQHLRFDEVNINCGCPSDSAGAGVFGASLMLQPPCVLDIVNATHEALAQCEGQAVRPVTVKCRIGVDDVDSFESLCDFVRTVSSSGVVTHFIIHARKAFLKGLSPADNRSVPPLRYDVVYRLLREFPALKFTLNGGVASFDDVATHFSNGVAGVMIGRGATSNPWMFADADRRLFGGTNPAESRRSVLLAYAKYCEQALRDDPNATMAHLLSPINNLFRGYKKFSKMLTTAIRKCKYEETYHQVVPVAIERCIRQLPKELLDEAPHCQAASSDDGATAETPE